MRPPVAVPRSSATTRRCRGASPAASASASLHVLAARSRPVVYGAEYWVRWFLFGVFAFFLLAPAMFGDQTQGWARRFLASKPLVLLGTVSLGFYLFHLAVMANVQEWLAPDGTSSVFYGSPARGVRPHVRRRRSRAAFLSYYLVEKPFLRLKDKSPCRRCWHRDRPAESSVSDLPSRGRAARDHPGVQRRGVAARGAQGAGRAASRRTTCSSCPTAPSTAPPRWRGPRASHVAVLPFNLGIGGALRTGFAYAVRHGYERAVQFDADGQHDPAGGRGCCSTASTPAPTWSIGSRFAEGGAVTYRVSRDAPPGDAGAAVAGQACWCASTSPTPARASARSRARCSSSSRRPTRWSTWTPSRRWSRRATPASASKRCPRTSAAARGRAVDPHFKLVYYYVRLLVVLLVSTTSRGQRASAARPSSAKSTTRAASVEHLGPRPRHRARGGGDRVHRAPRAQPAPPREVLGALVLDRPRPGGPGDLPRPAGVALRPVRDRLPAGHLHAARVELPARAGAALLVGALAPRGPHPALAEEHALLREEIEQRVRL